MIKRNSIKLKAAFLLAVFSLNTLVGIACNMGVKMIFNDNHHSDAVSVVHIHADGKEHIHYEKKKDSHNKKHAHNKLDKQDAAKEIIKNSINLNTGENNKGNCCTEKVLKFDQTDKTVAKSFSYLSPVFAIGFINAFYIAFLYASDAAPKIRYFVRSHHPPIPDIRIAIQSFQI